MNESQRKQWDELVRIANEQGGEIYAETINAAAADLTDGEKLAGLFLAYITADGMRPTTPPQAIALMRELAAKLAPQPVADAPAFEGVTVAGKYAELPVSALGTQVFEALADDKQNMHFKPKP